MLITTIYFQREIGENMKKEEWINYSPANRQHILHGRGACMVDIGPVNEYDVHSNIIKLLTLSPASSSPMQIAHSVSPISLR